MPAQLYSLDTGAHVRQTGKRFRVTAKLDEAGSGKNNHWQLSVKMNGAEIGSKRFPFNRPDKPPTKEATKAVKEAVKTRLQLNKANEVAYDDLLRWRQG